MRINSKKVVWNGIWYPSISDAANAQGITWRAMNNRLLAGYTCDDDLVGHYQISVIWNGVQYDSIKEAANAAGIGISTMNRYYHSGYTCEEDIPERKYTGGRARKIVWNDVVYESLAEAARELGISREAMRLRILNGHTCDADLDSRFQPKRKR